MNFLLQKVKIIDPTSPHHGKRMDVLVRRGKIEQIEKSISSEGVKVISINGACLSPGWLDFGTQIGEPGREYREDTQSIARAAMKGGYTAIAPFPNTDPVIDNHSMIGYIKAQSAGVGIDFVPIGAISKGCKGEDIAELIDMSDAGAKGFSDGNKPIHNEGLMLRALQYAKRFNGLIIDQPSNHNMVPEAQVHEGKASTMMGLKGIPSLTETNKIKRDIELANYAESDLCLHLISTGEGVDLIKSAKKSGQSVNATVGAFNLCFSEEDVIGFDPNMKFDPPLRTKSDKSKLVKGLQKGHLSVVVTQHTPLEEEKKETAFFDASYGSIGLQTTFAMLMTKIGDDVDLNVIITALCHNPRNLLGIDVPTIKEGNSFNATLFHPKKSWTFTNEANASKSKNTSLGGATFSGCVLGCFNKSVAVWNVEV